MSGLLVSFTIDAYDRSCNDNPSDFIAMTNSLDTPFHVHRSQIARVQISSISNVQLSNVHANIVSASHRLPQGNHLEFDQ